MVALRDAEHLAAVDLMRRIEALGYSQDVGSRDRRHVVAPTAGGPLTPTVRALPRAAGGARKRVATFFF